MQQIKELIKCTLQHLPAETEALTYRCCVRDFILLQSFMRWCMLLSGKSCDIQLMVEADFVKEGNVIKQELQQEPSIVT